MITETLTGAFATTELVGREKELERILDRIQDRENTRSCLIFLEGPGGIGKTRLLNEVIGKCKNLMGIKVSDCLIDAYHLLYHSPVEFVQAVYDSLKPLDEPFRTYERDARVLQNIRLSGEAVQVEAQIEQALKSFVENLQAFLDPQTKKQNEQQENRPRVVIVLDTVERFFYSADETLPEGMPTAETWTWLTSQLKDLSNVVIVAAGRVEAKPLFNDLDSSIEIIPIEIDKFSLDEAQAYFPAAARTARQNKAERVARVLESLSPEEIEQAYNLTEGRPILLALVADCVANGELLQPIFDASRTATGKTPQERFCEKILERLLNLDQLGAILRYMALMPKGMDTELFGAVLDLPENYMGGLEDELRKIEKFSFIKQRSVSKQQKSYFLHDELSVMLKQAIFGVPFQKSGLPDKDTLYERVIECYESRFIRVRRQLGKLYTAVQTGGENQIDWEELKFLNSQRAEILLALLYYRLRQDPPKGYRRWYRYDHEAVIGGDLLFSDQLRLELTAYQRELNAGSEIMNPKWDADLVRWSLLLHPVKHAWSRRRKELLKKVQDLEKGYSSYLEDPIQKAMLLIWKAYGLTASNPVEAHEVLDKLILALKKYRKDDEVRSWLDQMLLAVVYRVKGYTYRVQGEIDNAIDNYRQAAVLAREVDLKTEIATVNNDLGFALMLKGESSDARSLANNALEVRRELGLGSQVAYSVNTLALIETYEGRYTEAMENATKALNLFRAVHSERGIGLALIALAEATRRQSAAMTGATVQTRLDSLNRACEMADEALAIFEEAGGEKSRQVEALIEKGCARRDAVRLVRESSTSLYGKEKWIKESRMALEKAAEIAVTLVEPPQVHYRQVDALVNLAWLGFYAGEEIGETIRQEAEKRADGLLKEYELPEGKPKPAIFGQPDYQPLLSTQLGKLHILRGHGLYNLQPDAWKYRLDNPRDAPADLRDVYANSAREYFLGLEHSALYSLEYRDLRLAKQQIFDRLKVLRPENLQLFVECLAEWEQFYNISIPPGSQLRLLLVKRALWSEEMSVS